MTTQHADGVIATLRATPRTVRLLLVGVTINRAGSFVQLFLVLYMTSLGFAPERAGLALSGYGTGAVAGILFSGWLTDRLGHRATIVASMAASGLLVGSLAALHSFPALLAVTTGAGFATQAYRPAATALLADLTSADRLLMVSASYRLALNIGAAVGPLAGALLVGIGYETLFLVDMATSVGFAVIAAKALPARATAGGATGEASVGYLGLLRDRPFVLFLASLFLIAVVDIQYLSTLPLSVDARGISATVYGALVALNAAFVILFELPITRVVQRRPVRAALTAGIALIGVGIGMFGLPGGVPMLVVATLVWSLGETIGAPSAVAYPALVAPDASRGRYVAAGVACQSTGFAVGPAAGTFLWANVGGVAWAAFVAVGLVAAALAWAGVRPTRAAD